MRMTSRADWGGSKARKFLKTCSEQKCGLTRPLGQNPKNEYPITLQIYSPVGGFHILKTVLLVLTQRHISLIDVLENHLGKNPKYLPSQKYWSFPKAYLKKYMSLHHPSFPTTYPNRIPNIFPNPPSTCSPSSLGTSSTNTSRSSPAAPLPAAASGWDGGRCWRSTCLELDEKRTKVPRAWCCSAKTWKIRGKEHYYLFFFKKTCTVHQS